MSDFLRSEELSNKYSAHRASGVMDRGCVLCAAKPIRTFTYWKVIPNEFPYDLIAKTHHMLVPIRHVKENELSEDERAEFTEIKRDYVQQYDYTIEATSRTKSVPEHFHLHLIIGKRFGTD